MMRSDCATGIWRSFAALPIVATGGVLCRPTVAAQVQQPGRERPRRPRARLFPVRFWGRSHPGCSARRSEADSGGDFAVDGALKPNRNRCLLTALILLCRAILPHALEVSFDSGPFSQRSACPDSERDAQVEVCGACSAVVSGTSRRRRVTGSIGTPEASCEWSSIWVRRVPHDNDVPAQVAGLLWR